MYQLEGDLNVARMTAINQGQPVTVLFDAAGRQYTAFIDTDRNLALNGAEVLLFPARKLSSGVTFFQINVANNGVLFNGRGLRALPQADPADVVLQNGYQKKSRITVSLVGDIHAK